MNRFHRLGPVRKKTALNRMAWNLAFLAMLVAGAASLSGCSRSGGQTVRAEGNGNERSGAAEQSSKIHIPEGTNIEVRLLSSISSRSARSGDEFEAEMAEPVVVDGNTVFDKRAPARVRIVSAQASGRLNKPGFLSLSLAAIEDPNGTWQPVTTTLISVSGGSHKDRNATLIGGGTAVGAVIGAIAGGGKGAAIGAISGAGAGTAGAMATGRKDVTIPTERLLKFKSIGDIALNR